MGKHFVNPLQGLRALFVQVCQRNMESIRGHMSPHVQTGLKAQQQQEVVFASYNEQKIRHFWQTLYEWLDIDETPVEL